jgi:hypothetical protein
MDLNRIESQRFGLRRGLRKGSDRVGDIMLGQA